MTSAISQLLPILTLIAQVIVVLLVVGWLTSRKELSFVKTHALTFAFVVALVATLGSLFYSEVLGFEPCKLCWFQRIFMYPQVILLGLAAWRKDHGIIDYTAILSAIGGIIAAFHYYLQITDISILPCSATGYSASCSQRFVMEFGYITIPLMALTAFALIFLIAKRHG
jgi:disulfide bond formation protein DsbB